jgi:hypothetical protein
MAKTGPINPFVHRSAKLLDIFFSVNMQNDLISWLLDSADEDQKTVNDVVLRILVINFASIHTTSSVRLST